MNIVFRISLRGTWIPKNPLLKMKAFCLERMVWQVVRSPGCVYYTTRIAQLKGFQFLTYLYNY